MEKAFSVLVALMALASASAVKAELSTTEFMTPPKSTRLHTWWHWMDGHISKEGITKDLESMHHQGIVQVTIINIGKNYPREVEGPRIKFNSPEWIEMFQWALAEASRLGITMGTQTIDGYGTTGGPWITPEMSMKQYVWTTTDVTGGQSLDLALPQPLVVENFYRDFAVIAYPSTTRQTVAHEKLEHIKVNGVAVGNILTDGNPRTLLPLKKGDTIDITFKENIEVDQLAFLPHLVFCWDNMAKVSARFTLLTSADGKDFKKVADAEITGVNQSAITRFAPVKQRFFRLQFADHNLKFLDSYPLAELEFLAGPETPSFSPRITSFFEKTASVFDVGGKVFEQSPGEPAAKLEESAVLDLTKFMAADGTLKWQAPAGNWRIIRFGYTSTGLKNDPPTPEGTGLEADKMDSAALDLHINSYAKKLVEAAGKYKGNTLKFFLMDSWEAEFQTWGEKFPQEFRKQRGYEILPWLPVLCGEVVGSIQLSEAFLHDYRKTIAELIDRNYYKRFSELSHENGMELHAEAIYNNWGGYPPLEPLKANQYSDVPMTEFWAEQDENNFPAYKPEDRPKPGFPTSSALAYDKQLIGSEAYTSFAHFSETPFALKPYGDASYCSGVNQLILHSFVHQPFDRKPGMTLGKFGAHFNRNNPWWEFTQDWLTYQARVQYVLQKGYPVVDVMFHAGDELSQNFTRSFLSDLPIGIQANACNFEMLEKRAVVLDGKLSFGGKPLYPILMLPNSTKMDLVTLQTVARLVREGAVAYGPKPLEMLSLSDIKSSAAEFKSLADELWGNLGENHYGKGIMLSGMPLADALSRLKLLPDLTTDRGDAKEVMYIHRKDGDRDIYFVFNQQNQPLNRELLFRMSEKTPEIWDPATGRVSAPAIFSQEGAQTRIPVSLKPYESKIFIFKKEAPASFIRKVSIAGRQIFPRLDSHADQDSLPQVTRRNDSFEFVNDHAGKYSFETHDGRALELEMTTAESITLQGMKTKIEFSSIATAVIPSIEVTELKSLTDFEDPAIKYFSGKAKYSMEFSVPENLIAANRSITLNLGDLSATAEVTLNGTPLGFAWIPNSGFDVTRILKKVNTLEVTVANVCRNRFIGDLRQSGGIESLWTTSPIETILNKDMPLKPSGLIGPVALSFYQTYQR